MFHARSLSSGQQQKQDKSTQPPSCQPRCDTLFLTKQKNYGAAQDPEWVSITQSNLSHATTWCKRWASVLASAATQSPTLTALGKQSAALTFASQPQIRRQTMRQAAAPAQLARFSLQMKKPSAQRADVDGVGSNKAAEPESLCRLVAGASITMSYRRRWGGTRGSVVCFIELSGEAVLNLATEFQQQTFLGIIAFQICTVFRQSVSHFWG